MDVKVKYTYQEGYLPTKRHKILRYRNAEDEMTVHIPEITDVDAPVAFIVKEGHGKNKYRLWNDTLWVLAKSFHYLKNNKNSFSKMDLKKHLAYRHRYFQSKEEAIKEISEMAAEFVIINGRVYKSQGEPRYVVMTFGLGHNHGGTALMIDNYYNPNISKDAYFNALQRKEAIDEAKRTAQSRGDTDSIKRIGAFYNIQVLMPEAVKCNPQKEHGDGDPFLNRINTLTEVAPDSLTAGLLVIGEAVKQSRL